LLTDQYKKSYGQPHWVRLAEPLFRISQEEQRQNSRRDTTTPTEQRRQTGADEQKYLNLKANPYVVLVTGSSDWDSGIGVVVEGKAVHVTDEAVLSRVAEAFTVRWDGRWQYEVRDGRFYYGGGTGWPCEVFGVTPAKAFAHAKGDPFGATTHRF